MSRLRLARAAACALPALLAIAPRQAVMAAPPAWSGFGGDAQHTARAPAAPQPLSAIHWTTPVDAAPQIVNGELLIHYASPMITAANTVLIPVKGTATGGFRVEARTAATGALRWTLPTDYVTPPHDWTPPLPAALAPSGQLYVAGAGGTLLSRATPDLVSGTQTRTAFFGNAAYLARAAAFNAGLFINTPLTIDAQGTVFFGFVTADGSLKDQAGVPLANGIARVTATGAGTWVAAAKAAGSGAAAQVAQNAAPALSKDGKTLYVAIATPGQTGKLLALDSTTLATKAKAALLDPASGQPALLHPDSSASPLVGPDGDVFFGVLETPVPRHNDRGWLLHFDATLATLKTPGSFGWDNTASIVPAASIPSYTGRSSYLLMSKYNNYYGLGTGDGKNRIAVIDPGNAAPDPVLPTVKSMATVISLLGPTTFPTAGQGPTNGASTPPPSMRPAAAPSPTARTVACTAGTCAAARSPKRCC